MSSTGAAPESDLFVAELRRLRQRTGLSLAALAARTPYSKSAWHRYLNGTKPPPRSAVEALARLAGAEPGHVLDLWEAVDRRAAADTAADMAGTDGESAEADAREGSGRPLPKAYVTRIRGPLVPVFVLVALAVAVAVTAAATGSTGTSDSSGSPRARGSSSSPGAGGPSSPPGSPGSPQKMSSTFSPRCHDASCQGQLPDASTCGRDAQTKSTVTDTSYAVRLRYSPSCGTAWSEVQMHTSGPREISVRSGQNALSATYPGNGSDEYMSPMMAVPSPEGVEACAEVAGKLACTGLDAGREVEGGVTVR